MSSKQSDLQLVFSAVCTSGLRALSAAMRRGRLIRGRFTDGCGGGCVVYWLSEREIVDRPSRAAWTAAQLLFRPEHVEALKRLIVGWDAGVPDLIVKGPGYECEYPQATYIVTEAEIRSAIAWALRERRAANRAEREAQLPAAELDHEEFMACVAKLPEYALSHVTWQSVED